MPYVWSFQPSINSSAPLNGTGIAHAPLLQSHLHGSLRKAVESTAYNTFTKIKYIYLSTNDEFDCTDTYIRSSKTNLEIFKTEYGINCEILLLFIFLSEISIL